jgi:glycosyltransferase A (GT-A) superfamily protein (DUF2064 family)
MVKQPVAGRVKTRLSRDIGHAAALRFYRANTRALITRLSRDPRWQTVLSIAPPTALAARAFPAHLPRAPQSLGDIGRRMQAALAAPLMGHLAGAAPPGPVVLIGSDIAAVAPAHIATAFRRLADRDLVFGPAPDGGFWLIGMRRAPRILEAFPAPVTWSAPTTLAECLRALAGVRVGFADTLSDTDTAADLARLAPAAGRVILPKQTFATLDELPDETPGHMHVLDIS